MLKRRMRYDRHYRETGKKTPRRGKNNRPREQELTVKQLHKICQVEDLQLENLKETLTMVPWVPEPLVIEVRTRRGGSGTQGITMGDLSLN